MGTSVNPLLIKGNLLELGGSTHGFGGPISVVLHGTDSVTNDANLDLRGNATVRGNLTVQGVTVFKQVTVSEAQNASFQGDTQIGDATTPGSLTVYSGVEARGQNWTWRSGVLGTDPIKLSFVASTGALTVEGLISANGGATVPSGKTLTVNGVLNVAGAGATLVDAAFSGLVTANLGVKLGNGQKLTFNDATAEVGTSGARLNKLWVTTVDALSILSTASIPGSASLDFTVNAAAGAGNPSVTLKAAGVTVDPSLFWDNAAGAQKLKVNKPFSFQANNVDGTGTFTLGALTVTGATSLNGNVNLGDGTADQIAVTGRFTSTLLPLTTATVDVGSAVLRWGVIYAGAMDITAGFNAGGPIVASGFTTTGPVAAGTLVTTATAVIGTDLTVNGNTILGDAAADTLTVTASIASNLIPTGTRHLGATASASRWGTFFGVTVDVTGAIAAGGTITGAQIISTGSVQVGSDLTVNGNTTLGDAATDTVTVLGKISSLSPVDSTRTLGASADRWSNVFTAAVNVSGAVTAGSAAISGTLTAAATTVTSLTASGTIQGTAGAEPLVTYNGPSIFDGTQSGQAPTAVATMGDALDNLSPYLRGPVRLDRVLHAVSGFPAGTAFYINFVTTTAPLGYNVAFGPDGQPMIDVVRDGQLLLYGTDTNPTGDDFDIVSDLPGTRPTARNVIKFHEALDPDFKLWYRYHRKSKAT